jgi:hypothetical protein
VREDVGVFLAEVVEPDGEVAAAYFKVTLNEHVKEICRQVTEAPQKSK